MLFKIILLAICSISSIKNDASNDKVLVSLYTDNPLVIDAQIDKPEWNTARSITFRDDSFRNFPRMSDNLVEVRTLWDEDNLYILFRVYDRNIQSIQTDHEHPLISSDDIVEFLINKNNDKVPCWNENNVIYHINLHGRRLTDRGNKDCRPNREWNGNAEIAVQLFGELNDTATIDDGYMVEVSVSWKELEITPHPGLRLGVNFAVGDSRIFFDWAGGKPFRTPESFGELVLEKF